MAFQISASDPLIVFGALAGLIFLGFAGNLIFSRLRFNDTLILILVGVLIGPIIGWLNPESLESLSIIIGPLALILILFDGGLALKFQDITHGLGSAAMLGLVGFVLTTGIVGALTSFALDVPIEVGLVLGGILGGTSALVVLPSLQHMKTAPKTAATLGLESALTDILVVVVSFTLIGIAAAGVIEEVAISGEDIDLDGLDDAWEFQYFNSLDEAGDGVPDLDGRNTTTEFEQGTDPGRADDPPRTQRFDAQGIASKLLITFAMSLFMGVAAALMWLGIYPRVSDKAFAYMLTLGFMFALYVFVEWILGDVSQGGGPLAVLAFGVVLGNCEALGNLGRRVGNAFGSGMKRFQGEIAFLVRTFFFVYLGAIVDPTILADTRILGIGLLLFGGMLVARYIAVVATTRKLVLRGDAMVLFVMMPRGLAAAVLAAIPFQEGIPGTESFVALAFHLLVMTNLLSTLGAIWLEKKGIKFEEQPPPEPVKPARGGSRSATKSTTKSTSKSTTRKTPAKKASQTQASLEKLGRSG